MLYIALILGPIIAACIWFGLNYNNGQVDKKLTAGGVTLYTRVSNVYQEENTRGGPRYYAVLDYVYKGKHLRQSFNIDYGYCFEGDTVMVRRLIDNDSPTYMKVIGVRSNGVDLIRSY